jgi:hypothetical protein
MISGVVAVVLADYLLYILWIIISISIGGIAIEGRSRVGEGRCFWDGRRKWG